ncbi:unnamed protein product [Brassica oleracea]
MSLFPPRDRAMWICTAFGRKICRQTSTTQQLRQTLGIPMIDLRNRLSPPPSSSKASAYNRRATRTPEAFLEVRRTTHTNQKTMKRSTTKTKPNDIYEEKMEAALHCRLDPFGTW